jgi:hypothetical protein
MPQATASREAHVRQVIQKMEFSLGPAWLGTGRPPLDKSYAASLLRVLPSIKIPRLFAACADELRIWKYKPAVPFLVSSLKNGPAAQPALTAWGWEIFGILLRAARTGTYRQRLLCTRILADHGRDRPVDARLTRLFLEASRSESTEFRSVATSGLYWQAGRIEGWMEMTHPATMDSSVAFERLIQMVMDQDGGVANSAANDIYEWFWSRNQSLPSPYPGLMRDVKRDELGQLSSRGATEYDRSAAIALLFKHYDQSSEHVHALNDSSPLVRRTAVFLLSAGIKKELLPELIKESASPIETTRIAAAQVLGRSFFPEAVNALQRLLEDPYPDVRTAASRGLIYLGINSDTAQSIRKARRSHSLRKVPVKLI